MQQISKSTLTLLELPEVPKNANMNH